MLAEISKLVYLLSISIPYTSEEALNKTILTKNIELSDCCAIKFKSREDVGPIFARLLCLIVYLDTVPIVINSGLIELTRLCLFRIFPYVAGVICCGTTVLYLF